MPVDDRVYAHEGRPIVVGGVEVREMGAIGVGPPCADEDRFYRRVCVQIQGECVAKRDDRFWHGVYIVAAAAAGGAAIFVAADVYSREGSGEGGIGVRAFFLGGARVRGYVRQVEVVELRGVVDEVGHRGEWVGWFGVDGGDGRGKGGRVLVLVLVSEACKVSVQGGQV